MFSLRTTLLALATAAVVSADYYVDPDTVSMSTRTAWCASELSTCPIICQQVAPHTTELNTCDPETLKYGCLCGNGQQPNITEYSLTLPYFVCQEWGNQCVKACGSDGPCASACRQDHPCGALSPKLKNKTSSSTSTTASATASATDGVFTGLGDGSSGSGTPNSARQALAFGQAYGLLVVGGSLFAGFALML